MKQSQKLVKQGGVNSAWCNIWAEIPSIYFQETAVELVNRTVDEIKRTIAGKRVGYGWSGGKDSQALRVVMEAAGVERCVLGMTLDLEFPEFLQWTTPNMPQFLDVVASDQDLPWLAEHQEWLFPQASQVAGRWFASVQHHAQTVFFNRYDLDLLIVGRRKADRNQCGDKNGLQTNGSGVSRYSPIRNWTHLDCLGVCYWYGMPLPPCYSWPNGWIVGTGAWPARQWTGSIEQGWKEIWQIDKSIVTKAADYIESAAEFLKCVE